MTPVLALTQGDPAGIGPELCLLQARAWRAASPCGDEAPRRDGTGAESRAEEGGGEAAARRRDHRPVLAIERAVVDAVASMRPELGEGLRWVEAGSRDRRRAALEAAWADGVVPALDPVGGGARPVRFGSPSAEDAAGAVAAIDLATSLALDGEVDAVVTAPVNKAVIARSVDPGFRGHTDHLAALCSRRTGTTLRYGRDYLMAFIGGDLSVALLSTHVPLRTAIDGVTTVAVLEALRCMHRAAPVPSPRIALAGLNPHAGEGGLLGLEDGAILAPAVSAARDEGIDVRGPESPDTVFLRARRGAFDWVLALYHDQGLIAVKTVGFGSTVNWTMGLPVLRTSVDHGTAYDLGGWGRADDAGMAAAVAAAARLAADAAG